MTTSKFSRYWTLVTILLIAIIAISSIVAWARYSRSQPVEISLPPEQELTGEIYIGGAVSNPGLYPLKSGDTLAALIQDAGGTTDSTDLNQLKLYVLKAAEGEQPQKININRAEAWLLEALPGIGENRAQAIMNYREQHGPFHSIREITEVEGIGITLYEQIKDLITVAD